MYYDFGVLVADAGVRRPAAPDRDRTIEANYARGLGKKRADQQHGRGRPAASRRADLPDRRAVVAFRVHLRAAGIPKQFACERPTRPYDKFDRSNI